MATAPSIILNNITSRYLPPKIGKVNLSFGQHRYGVVGKNGIGKTTLLKLLGGADAPHSGVVQHVGSVSYVPQLHATFSRDATVASVLEVDSILRAISNITNGLCDEYDFETVGDQWDIEARVSNALQYYDLDSIDIKSPFSQLSGGQKTKILLAKIHIFPADFILLDEPTNNLDKPSRNILYRYIVESTHGLIIASHDRTLLNHCDTIIEVTANGIFTYGGNYDAYKLQKEIALQALEHNYQDAKNTVKKAKLSIQNARERHSQRQSGGRQLRKSGSQTKIILDGMKARSENTQAKMCIKEERMINKSLSKLEDIKEKREIHHDFHVKLVSCFVPKNKVILNIEALGFCYEDKKPLIDCFNLKIVGPERVAVTGQNGAGKTTLIQLILGNLLPAHGQITNHVKHMTYLDQKVSFLDHSQSIIDNFLRLNSEATTFDTYAALATFNFRNVEAEKIVGQLSGGEKMCAGLAVALMSATPPQLIILDEPTNHLDVATVEAIERALRLYQGAILAVSHDDVFLKNIGIERYITIQ